MANLPKGLIKQ